MVRLLLFVTLLKPIYSSFCGTSAVPFSFEALPDGQPVLGCAQPKCFDLKEDPQGLIGRFYRINKKPDGFFRSEADQPNTHAYSGRRHRVRCDSSFESLACDSDNQWTAGIAPLVNVSSSPTALQCCTFEPLRMSSDRGVATVKPGQIVIGGEVIENDYQYAFDYISNIEKIMNSDGTVIYLVNLRRYLCPQEEPQRVPELVTLKPPPKAEQEIRRAPERLRAVPLRAVALQAEVLPANDPIPLQGNQVAFQEENVVVEEIIAQDATEITSTTEVTEEPTSPLPPVRPEPPLPAPIPPQQFIPEPIFYPAPAAPPPVPAYYGGGTSGYYCFTGDTKVNLIDGSEKRMDELNVQDWVQTLIGSEVKYAPVTFWLHKVPSQTADFLRIELSDGSDLKLTSKHFIYKTKCATDGDEITSARQMSREAVLAEKVRVGDCLYRVTEDERVLLTRVVEVSTIIVNGVLASCHTIVQSNSLQNSFFTYAEQARQLYASFFPKATEIAELPFGMDILATMLDYIIPKDLISVISRNLINSGVLFKPSCSATAARLHLPTSHRGAWFLLPRNMSAINVFERALLLNVLLLLYHSVTHSEAALTFERYCYHPLHGGRSKLKGDNCTVRYPYETENRLHALEICTGFSPFHVVEYFNGTSTRCIYERPHYYCDGEGEELIGDRCYQVRGYSAFADHEKACGNRYRIHKMEDLNTVRWISGLFGDKVNDVWIGNKNDSTTHLQPVLPRLSRGDRKAAAKGQLALKLRIMTCCNDGHEIGTTIFANTKRKNAFLCSRPAGITAKGIKKIADKMREVGFQVERARDKLSDPRLFTVLHSVTPFKRSLKQLNQACRPFPNGHVATKRDFADDKEYRRILSKFPEANFHHESQEYCPKPNGNEEMGDSNCKQNVKEEHNSNQHSDAASKMIYKEPEEKWLVGNHHLMCSFGSPRGTRVRHNDRVFCHKEAIFDKESGQCQCNPPRSDCKLMDSKKYSRYHPGHCCLSCKSFDKQRSVVFLVDSNRNVGPDGWRKQLNFVAEMMQFVKNVRIGVVVLSCPAIIELRMGNYPPEVLRKWAANRQFNQSATNAIDAYRYAEQLLDAEASSSKSLIVLSNGQTTNCIDGVKEPGEYRYEEQKHVDRIIYISIIEYDLMNALRIAGGAQNFINVKGFEDLDTTALHRAISMICSSEAGR
ncbi:hypothetical protein Q1695_015731 [Nippostrongylus brasiliensis]|nr:hypothetical protein Q1695_015731 [Nippostrongylus brasiliensis]